MEMEMVDCEWHVIPVIEVCTLLITSLVARQSREKLNRMEPTLTLGHLLCKVLGQRSLQTCSVFFLYEVVACAC